MESLEGKTYAVDASILLNQALKGMKDQPNAHLHVLFLRLCKLLTYKIKPIFVFDGGVPILKRQTIAARQRKREEAAEQAQSKFYIGFLSKCDSRQVWFERMVTLQSIMESFKNSQRNAYITGVHVCA